jgi:beta-lactamase class A
MFFNLTKNNLLKFFLSLSLLILIIESIFIISLFKENNQLKGSLKEHSYNFSLLSPNIAWIKTEEFLDIQKKSSINYWGLKSKFLDEIQKDIPKENVGIYFEDLFTGSWVGINEKNEFYPRSLFKVPVMVTILKKIEDGELSLSQNVILEERDIDSLSGDLYKKGVGYKISVKELINLMIKNSDNTALRALTNNFLNGEDYIMTISMMGLIDPNLNQSISPKGYMNIFRSLYYSTYLKRSFSELALSILTETDFNSQLTKDIPPSVKVSHKWGEDVNLGIYHDCGIFYIENKNYMLCVMTKNVTKEQADNFISKISKITYDYITSADNFDNEQD